MTRPGLDDRGGIERAAVWLVVLVLVVGIVGSVVYVSGDLRRDVPESDFATEFDAETATLTLTHADGDGIGDRGTVSLVVEITDADTGATVTVPWAGERVGYSKRGFGFPVREGDAITIDDPTVDADGDGNYHDADASVGIHLSEGDRIRVVWEGSRRTGDVKTVTLANATVGES